MRTPARVAGRLGLAALGALALWLAFAGDAWGRGVAAASEAGLRAFERPRVTRLELEKGAVLIRRSDMGSGSDVPSFDAGAFTAPTLLLLTLLWGAGRLVPRRGAWRGFAALGILFLAQALHLALAVETLYATQLGEWSLAAYPRWQRELFATSRALFDLALAWGLPVAMWVGFFGLPAFRAAATGPAARKGKKK